MKNDNSCQSYRYIIDMIKYSTSLDVDDNKKCPPNKEPQKMCLRMAISPGVIFGIYGIINVLESAQKVRGELLIDD